MNAILASVQRVLSVTAYITAIPIDASLLWGSPGGNNPAAMDVHSDRTCSLSIRTTTTFPKRILTLIKNDNQLQSDLTLQF